MHKDRIAEWLLESVTTRERAASTVGDLRETAAARGGLVLVERFGHHGFADVAGNNGRFGPHAAGDHAVGGRLRRRGRAGGHTWEWRCLGTAGLARKSNTRLDAPPVSSWCARSPSPR
jgi:hypothetical protein